MATFGDLSKLRGRSSALPPAAARLAKVPAGDYTGLIAIGSEPEPISAFVCLIDYKGETRPISCRKYKYIGEVGYVGAICLIEGGYKEFRCDRIEAVFDAETGEAIGDGTYFERFAVDGRRERASSWGGLTSSRKSTLVAGLNILAFMARCDGRWHPLETSVIEQFVCSMWLRKEWEGSPPLDEIVEHAQRLAPDSDTFFSALRQYAGSDTSKRIIRQAIGDLVAADGVICSAEMHWGAEVNAFFDQYTEELYDQYFNSSSAQVVRIQ